MQLLLAKNPLKPLLVLLIKKISAGKIEKCRFDERQKSRIKKLLVCKKDNFPDNSW
jgi:hypothetical protein